MRTSWMSPLLALVLAPALVVPSTGGAAPPAAHPASVTAPPTPVLVAVRAAHRGDVDRVVFEFRGGLPAKRQVGYVDRLFADGSGRRVRVAGQALLRVRQSERHWW